MIDEYQILKFRLNPSVTFQIDVVLSERNS